MGDGPIGYPEILARVQISGVAIDGWEAETLIQMSREYMSARGEGVNEDAIAPIHQTGDKVLDMTNQVSAGVKSVLKQASVKQLHAP